MENNHTLSQSSYISAIAYCINAFLDRRDFQYLEMDTDSANMSLEELVKPDKKTEFATIQHHGTPEHRHQRCRKKEK